MGSSKNARENSFSLTLFDIYRKTDQKGPLPTFTLTDRDGARRQIPFLEPVRLHDEKDTVGKSVKSALHRLYPLAKKVFDGEPVFRIVPQELLKELNSAWSVGSDLLPVCFSRAGGFCLEEEYLLLYLEVQPLMLGIDAECLKRLAVMLTSKLCYREEHCPKLVRDFKPIKEDAQGRSEQKIAQDRFQGNGGSALIQGLTGTPVTVREILDDLAGPGWKSMLLDRFLLKSLLITPSEESVPAYSQADEENLIRLARGMNEKYLPAPLEAMAGHVMPVQTFANVLFLAANEGVSGHVKPAPGQTFLLNEFTERYRTEYRLLFVLAVYQHYRLIDLIGRLAKKTAEFNESGQSWDSNRDTNLRKLRQELATHEVKYINTQPAFLTNYQQYYTGLRQGLNTGALVEKLRRSVAELDALLAAEELHRNADKESKRKKRKERRETGELVLAVTAELFALPYYSYNVLKYISCLKNYAGWGTLTVTAVVVIVTFWFMWPRKSE